MSRSFTLTPLLILAAALPVRAGDPRPPTSAEDKARLVAIAKELEASPLGRKADDSRQWANNLVSNAPDIDGIACDFFFAHVLQSGSKFTDPLMQQQLISSGAYFVEHPDTPRRGAAAAPWVEAGVRGMVRAYLAIKKVAAKERIPFLDGLAELDKQGRLSRFVEDGWMICEQENLQKVP